MVHDAVNDGPSINLSYKMDNDDPELLLNHYQLQSREYWETVKMHRGDCNHCTQVTLEGVYAFYSLDIGDIIDDRLKEQNKEIGIMTIGMNNLGKNGRLGNQMFQYAALVGIAKQSGYDFVPK